jgi:hypothetical protein
MNLEIAQRQSYGILKKKKKVPSIKTRNAHPAAKPYRPSAPPSHLKLSPQQAFHPGHPSTTFIFHVLSKTTLKKHTAFAVSCPGEDGRVVMACGSSKFYLLRSCFTNRIESSHIERCMGSNPIPLIIIVFFARVHFMAL